MTRHRHDRQQLQAAFEAACEREGIRATQQRREIYVTLASSREHPDAESLHLAVKERLPAISPDTVYRNLRVLERHGLVQKVGVTGHRTRFDADVRPHHHFVCRRCGMIRDVTAPALDDFRLPSSISGVGRVESRHVELRGVCRSCAAADET